MKRLGNLNVKRVKLRLFIAPSIFHLDLQTSFQQIQWKTTFSDGLAMQRHDANHPSLTSRKAVREHMSLSAAPERLQQKLCVGTGPKSPSAS